MLREVVPPLEYGVTPDSDLTPDHISRGWLDYADADDASDHIVAFAIIGTPAEVAEANLRRLAASWNALRGYSVEQIEALGDVPARLAALEAQNAEITEALNAIKFRKEPTVAERVKNLIRLHNLNCAELAEIYTLCTEEPDTGNCGDARNAVQGLANERTALEAQNALLKQALELVRPNPLVDWEREAEQNPEAVSGGVFLRAREKAAIVRALAASPSTALREIQARVWDEAAEHINFLTGQYLATESLRSRAVALRLEGER